MRSGSLIDNLKKCKCITVSMHLYMDGYVPSSRRNAFLKLVLDGSFFFGRVCYRSSMSEKRLEGMHGRGHFYTINITLLIRRKALYKNLLNIQILKLKSLDCFLY